MPATLYYTPTSCGAATFIAAFKAGLLDNGKVCNKNTCSMRRVLRVKNVEIARPPAPRAAPSAGRRAPGRPRQEGHPCVLNKAALAGGGAPRSRASQLSFAHPPSLLL
jgi:hypothetical protein